MHMHIHFSIALNIEVKSLELLHFNLTQDDLFIA